ncbi:Mitochondrial fission process protein 1 [Candida viswanathii]|uniref:Mitochondrial fission process protein 1 n=1 Tax=Candida viswanathii TaxID=5486 RepID=A0A367YAU2_9ASCO|nr:Mitochondrial fission process protein 1 [Candida viswanathii]
MSVEPEQKTLQKVKGAVDDRSISEQESGLRYAAYANRLRTILLASHRYVAYTSDIGESFRPVAHPYLVKAGYAVSWLYILGDVSYAAWITKMKAQGRYVPGLKPWDKAPAPNEFAADTFLTTHSIVDTDWKLVALKRGIFQSVASMGLPAFTIHSAVRYSSYLFKNSSIHALKTYGPVAVGLGIVPVLPYIFDEPVEHVVDWVFDEGAKLYNNKKLQ